MTSDLDLLLEMEEMDRLVNQQIIKESLKSQQHSFLAKFQIDINDLYKKNDTTYYSKSSYAIKDGIVFKFNRGIPEMGQACVCIMKYDIRNKYHDYIAGRHQNIMCGFEVMPKEPYGMKPIIYIYPDDRQGIEDRLIYTSWNIRNTDFGAQSNGEIVECDGHYILGELTGRESSPSGNHGKIHKVLVVRGNPKLHIRNISNSGKLTTIEDYI